MPAQADKYAPVMSSGVMTPAVCNSRFVELQPVRLEEATALEVQVLLGGSQSYSRRIQTTPLWAGKAR